VEQTPVICAKALIVVDRQLRNIFLNKDKLCNKYKVIKYCGDINGEATEQGYESARGN
jgi:hypothetical protein